MRTVIVAIYIVVEIESNTRALQLNRNFSRGNVVELWRDYHMFDYSCTVRAYYIAA